MLMSYETKTAYQNSAFQTYECIHFDAIFNIFSLNTKRNYKASISTYILNDISCFDLECYDTQNYHIRENAIMSI